MKLYEVYFSPTGGTKKVSSIISNEFNCEKETIDILETDKKELYLTEEDICMISVPSFGGRVPELALQYVKNIHGSGAKAILVAVFGNRDFEDTLIELYDAAEDSALKCVAAISAVAEHSILRQFGMYRPDKADETELKEFANTIKEKIASFTEFCELSVPGSRPYVHYNGVPFKPIAGVECNNCGTCAKKCPTGAISPQNPHILNKDLCISCMRCIDVCPQNARKNSNILLATASLMFKKAFIDRKDNKLYLAEQ